ncbi:Transcription factor bHLH35 [Camellia lanceoleosa]|uniref:Transcription factor bHLH35 n=1 Tax=Camellia lanceoleosa TaxID=1840588 RepID=A0ACC0I186_9ERIC|nr:Transcription factor bHLH35 [Camellia lanceoleosa]
MAKEKRVRDLGFCFLDLGFDDEKKKNQKEERGDGAVSGDENAARMDKASIIKDAIDYIQELHEQERRIQADLIQLESGKLKKNAVFDLDQEIPTLSRLKKKRIDHSYDSRRSTTSSIEDLEVSL